MSLASAFQISAERRPNRRWRSLIECPLSYQLLKSILGWVGQVCNIGVTGVVRNGASSSFRNADGITSVPNTFLAPEKKGRDGHGFGVRRFIAAFFWGESPF